MADKAPAAQSRDVKLAQGLHHGSLDGSLNLGLDLFRELRSQKGQLRCDTRSRGGRPRRFCNRGGDCDQAHA